MNIWELLEIAESTKAEKKDSRFFHENVEFAAKNRWKVILFYDGDTIDYIDSFISPDGEVIDFWDWEESKDKEILMSWRKIGDLKRLKETIE